MAETKRRLKTLIVGIHHFSTKMVKKPSCDHLGTSWDGLFEYQALRLH